VDEGPVVRVGRPELLRERLCVPFGLADVGARGDGDPLAARQSNRDGEPVPVGCRWGLFYGRGGGRILDRGCGLRREEVVLEIVGRLAGRLRQRLRHDGLGGGRGGGLGGRRAPRGGR